MELTNQGGEPEEVTKLSQVIRVDAGKTRRTVRADASVWCGCVTWPSQWEAQILPERADQFWERAIRIFPVGMWWWQT